MTAFDPTLAARIAESQVPMSADLVEGAGLSPQCEAGFRRTVAHTSETAACVAYPGALRDLLAELDRVRAERGALKQRLDAVLDLCDREQRNAIRWENPIPVPEWVATVQGLALGDVKPGTEAAS